MIYFPLILNVLLMIMMPIVAARFISVKRGISWGLFGIGAVTFIVSQIGHVPFNWLMLQRFKLISSDVSSFSSLVVFSLFLGLSAAMFEEMARFLTYRYWATSARSWGQGLMLGAGHGGIEAIILGVLVGINYFVLARMQTGAMLELIPTGQLPIVQAQIAALFSARWYTILLGAVERLFALSFHLSASLLVMKSLITGRTRWLLAAIIWHTLLNAAAVFAVVKWNATVAEAIIGSIAVISLIIICLLRSPEPQEPELESLPKVGPWRPLQIELSADNLEKSRYL